MKERTLSIIASRFLDNTIAMMVVIFSEQGNGKKNRIGVQGFGCGDRLSFRLTEI